MSSRCCSILRSCSLAASIACSSMRCFCVSTSASELSDKLTFNASTCVRTTHKQLDKHLTCALHVCNKIALTRRALGERKPPPNAMPMFPLCSPGGTTKFSEGLLYLAMVKNPSILSLIQMLIWITAKI